MAKNNIKRKLVPAIAMLACSAVMLSTATYAWFTMNKEVSVTNMQVKAKADQGLLINEVATATDPNWDEEATANQTTGGIQLHATSTANTNSWFYAYSKKANDAAAATASANSANLSGTYNSLTATEYEAQAASAGTNALTQVYYRDIDGDSAYDEGEGYYVKYTYYLKSSSDALTPSLAANGESLQIKEVTVTGNSGSAALDKSIRVAVVINNKAYIFAPLNDAAGTYYVGTGHTVTTPLTGNGITNVTSIPSVTTSGTPFYVYLYFEGEDANCKTNNITSTLDDLTVSFKLAMVENAADVTCNGVTVSST
jgi:hypothetical protein